MFLVLRKKKIFIFLLVIVICACAIGAYFAFESVSTPHIYPTIVIDAGHGGVDGGAVGAQGVSESLLNLQFSYTLKEICEDYGFSVVLTRKDMNGLYSAFASNKKRSEMNKRREIIKNANADLVVSIHMNSYNLSNVRGAQVFYAEGASTSQSLASCVQTALHEKIAYAKSTAKSADYYILSCTTAASILVECGFLSNTEEEKLLISEDYQEEFCQVLFYGILTYLGQC